jgi:ribosomal protein L16
MMNFGFKNLARLASNTFQKAQPINSTARSITTLTRTSLPQALFTQPKTGLNIWANVLNSPTFGVRHGSNLAPAKRKYRKAQKGRVPVRTGGSQKGNTIAFGDYGIRLKDGARLSASILTACNNIMKKKLKSAKGSKIWMRVFPDIPVTSKGNESRMGKGKGAFDYWACRVPKDKILFELGGPNLPLELAREAVRLASYYLPVKSQFVVKAREDEKAAAEAAAAEAQAQAQTTETTAKPTTQTL